MGRFLLETVPLYNELNKETIMAIIWNRSEEPAQEPIVEPIANEEEMKEWTETSAADLGELLYDEDDDMEGAKVWVKNKKGFGN